MPVLLLDIELPVSGATGPDLTRYFLVCGVLLATVGALAFLARRFLSRHLRRRAKARSLQVIDMLPLGGKQKLCVVRCYDRTFLLGLGDKEVRSIAELDGSDANPSALGTLDDSPTHGVELEPRAITSFDARLNAELNPSPARDGGGRDDGNWNHGKGLLG